MANPKISLITCTYFRPDLLRRTIQSVQKQSMEDYEHLIISDHCPFAEFVYSEFSDDKRIKFIKNSQPHIYNLGACSFNIGIENSKSKYISYVLDDDILYENHLEEHVNGLKNSNNSWFHSNFDNIEFNEPNNTVKNIVSLDYKTICDMALKLRERDGFRPMSFDVGALCHRQNINLRWTPQSKMAGGWEDTVFMSKLGVDQKDMIYTTIKVNWGGIHRKTTKGLNETYFDKLMKKVKVNSDSYGGYELIEDPLVYPEFKNTLYG